MRTKLSSSCGEDEWMMMWMYFGKENYRDPLGFILIYFKQGGCVSIVSIRVKFSEHD